MNYLRVILGLLVVWIGAATTLFSQSPAEALWPAKSHQTLSASKLQPMLPKLFPGFSKD